MNCPFCGKERKEGAAFCIYCGRKYSEAAPAENTQPAPEPPVPESVAPESPVPEATASESPIPEVQASGIPTPAAEQSIPSNAKVGKKKTGNNSGKKKKLPVIIAAAVGGLILLALIAVGVLGYLNYKSVEIVIDNTKMGFDEDFQVYYLSDDWSEFKGSVNCNIPLGLSKLSYSIRDCYDVDICDGTTTINSGRWVIKDPALMMGVNQLTVSVKLYFIFDFKKTINVANYDVSRIQGANISFEDSDEDGLYDYLEDCLGSDSSVKDTDSDGIMDGDEYFYTDTDLTKYSSRDDGISDYDYDSDGDGLINGKEIELGTLPVCADTDFDEVNDADEINLYSTDPLKYDTDEDGASDGWEIANGYDPLSADNSFVATTSCEARNSTISASAKVETSGDPEGVCITEAVLDGLLDSSIKGYMGSAFEFYCAEEFESATISFTFDNSVLSSDAQPTIYYWNEEEQVLEEIATTVSGNVASATVSHFSKYILLDKTETSVVVDEDITTLDEMNNTINQIAFVIDYSSSMNDNDPEYMRLQIAKEYLSKLRNGKDAASIIKFAGYATTLIPMSNDIESSINVLDDIVNTGDDSCTTSDAGTNGTDGLKHALDEVINSNVDPDTACNKYIIFLTDGEDNKNSYEYDPLIEEAVKYEIKIFTVGMGDCNEELLTAIAELTGGEYHYASATDIVEDGYISLGEAFSEIEEETIKFKDDNEDGIIDYYAQLICEGKLTTGSGSNPFNGYSYDEIQASNDLDGDGVINGNEVKVVQVGDKLILMFFSSPINADTDSDGFTDKDDIRQLKWDVGDRDLAFFSVMVYKDGKNFKGKMYTWDDIKNDGGISPFSSENDRGIADEWTLVDFSTGFSGFCAATYKSYDNIVISFRGSNDKLDWLENALTYNLQSTHAQEIETINYVKKISQKYPSEDFKIYVTGHSLGGYLAQIGTIELLKNNITPEAFVCFNAMGLDSRNTPGILSFLRADVAGGIKETVEYVDRVNNLQILSEFAEGHRVICYENVDDIVSLLGTHVGIIDRSYKIQEVRWKSKVKDIDPFDPYLNNHKDYTNLASFPESKDFMNDFLSYSGQYGAISMFDYISVSHEMNNFFAYLEQGTRSSEYAKTSSGITVVIDK